MQILITIVKLFYRSTFCDRLDAADMRVHDAEFIHVG